MMGQREFKCAVHVHSDWSYDGVWSLERLGRAFRRRGCRVVFMTEHDRGFDQRRWNDYRRRCRQAGDANLLFVPGIEYSDAENRIHVLVWGDEMPFLGERLPTDRLMELVIEHRALAVLAHPRRKTAWRHYRDSWAEGLTGIELWNRKTDGWAPGRRAAALLDRSGLKPFVGLDFHRPRQFFPLRMRLRLEGEVNPASAIEALRLDSRAVAFGQPVDSFLEGATAGAVDWVEALRRRAAPRVRATLGMK